MAVLPAQIRKQTEAVQELYKQLHSDGDATGGDNAPAVEAQASEESDNSVVADENYATNSAASSVESEQKTTDDRVAEETVLQKYRTLQGMYNAEVPRLHAQNKDLQNRLQHMEQLLSTLSAQQAKPAAQTQQAETLVSAQDVEEYGESLDVMRKVSREELNPVAARIARMEQMIQQMQANIVPQVQAVAQRQAVSAEQAFWADLAKAVPNWSNVNDSEDFQSWLLAIDPLTGISRQTYLEEAQRSLDADRVANFFRTWIAMSGQAANAQDSGRAQPAAVAELERQVTPGKSRAAGTPQSNKGKVYSPDDITRFFNDVRSGKFKGREAERDRIERDIFAAQRENRIQNTA